jgi:Zn-dependent peptidase ImmA (M78 family)
MQYTTRTDGTVVPAQSAENIALIANAVRKYLGITDTAFFPVVKVYELLGHLIDGADFEIHTKEEMGEDHGRTYPDKKVILIREDVYEGADKGMPRDRFTMCHELGHLVMHQGLALSRIDPKNPPKIYRNSEWQADKFASFLLMPKYLLEKCDSIYHVVEIFGVSYEAAEARRGEIQVIKK